MLGDVDPIWEGGAVEEVGVFVRNVVEEVGEFVDLLHEEWEVRVAHCGGGREEGGIDDGKIWLWGGVGTEIAEWCEVEQVGKFDEGKLGGGFPAGGGEDVCPRKC